MNHENTVLSVNDLYVDFALEKSVVHAVRGIGFCLEKKAGLRCWEKPDAANP